MTIKTEIQDQIQILSFQLCNPKDYPEMTREDSVYLSGVLEGLEVALKIIEADDVKTDLDEKAEDVFDEIVYGSPV